MLGFVLAGIGIIFILALLSKLISRLLNKYKLGTKYPILYKRLRTKDHELYKIKTTIESLNKLKIGQMKRVTNRFIQLSEKKLSRCQIRRENWGF